MHKLYLAALPLAALNVFGAVGHASAAQMPGLSKGLSQHPPYTCVVNYYVDAVNGNDSNPGTQPAPWRTIQNADNGYPNKPVPGECVNVLPGTYNLAKTLILGHGGDMNEPDHFVVYRSTVPQAAHILAASGIMNGGNGDLMMLWAPYLVIDGFEIDGNKELTSGHGIDGCANGGQPGNIAHHFTAINNIIHDMGGSGLGTCTADFIIWQHNVVYNTASTNPFQVSAIDVWQPKALAPGSYTQTPNDNRHYRIAIAFNIAYGNGEGPSIPAPHTDGNGIILDTTLGSSQCQTCGTPYPGNILVYDNLSYNNGGRGVHSFLSENITIANNTAYNNNLDTMNPDNPRGELTSAGSQNLTWVNNIAIATPGQGVLAGNVPALTYTLPNFADTGTWTQNITFGAAPVSDPTSYVNPATNMVGVDPMLQDPPESEFMPMPGSPAIGTGDPEKYIRRIPPNIGGF